MVKPGDEKTYQWYLHFNNSLNHLIDLKLSQLFQQKLGFYFLNLPCFGWIIMLWSAQIMFYNKPSLSSILQSTSAPMNWSGCQNGAKYKKEREREMLC